MVAQCGTAAVLFGTGDSIAQQAIEKKGFWAMTFVLFHPSPSILSLFVDTLDVVANYKFGVQVGTNGAFDTLRR